MFVEPGISNGMPLLVDHPTELGADRLAYCVGAYERYGGPCIVVDFGTATKFEVISERGEYLGGVIAPGLQLSADALFTHAARLSRVDITASRKGHRHQHHCSRAERVVLRLYRPGRRHA